MAETSTEQRDELRKYLDPQVLARIDRLDLRTRLIVEGFMTGLHRSPYQGLSVEFAQHREYVPGDDTRHVDWRVYSRTDRFFIKQYEEETNLRCTFVVDVSESMRYGIDNGAEGRKSEGGLTKFEYAACSAAALSHLLLRQQDAAGLITFDEDVVDIIPPSTNPSQLKQIVHRLDQASDRLSAKTDLGAVCLKIAEQLNRRGMVCLISDLLVDDDDALWRGLTRLTQRGQDVMILHVLDERELTFPFDGNTRFVGMEAAGELILDPRRLRESYMASLNEFLDRTRRECGRRRIGYATISTADHLGATLAAFLAHRTEVGRKGASKHR